MFLIIQNDPQCPPGSCAELIVSAGYGFQTLEAYAADAFPPLSSLTGIIVLGGEMSVYQTDRFPYLSKVSAFISEALHAGTPLLGICLGGQLLSQAAGGTVSSPSTHGEEGICSVDLNERGASDPLFAGVPSNFITFQLHQDSFTVPPGATLLASSKVCPAQAFRLGNAYGLQFHPEVDRQVVSCWGSLFSPAKDFLSAFITEQPAFEASSHTILANFISLAARSLPVEIP